ncbi:MAG: diadenylate cyclase [Desulfobacterales bacterium]|nr:MAG: diadenylate cyclase [Desulfobacterales bacterium]
MDQISFFTSSLRWQDIVDITLNSYILFRFYVLFKGTNVFRVLVGMTLLWFFQRFAVSLGLIVTSWVVQGIAAVAALIIIVVFRNEIRTVLQAKNLKSIIWGLSYKTVTTPVETIVAAVYEMAQKKCGALIVFPGKEDITEVSQSGIPWRGLISKEMIMSIFWPDNPVHDGAAVIQEDQITRVGTILPLSQRNDLPSYYGTRHRAALGLSEATDALVIVVSEERGQVSVAKGSRLQALSAPAKLAQILQAHLGIAAETASDFRKEKLEIVSAALLSVVFITGVWYTVSRGLNTLVTLEIPVEYINRNPGVEIINTSASSVSLNLAGSGALIKSIRPENLRVRLDLSKAVVGLNSFAVTSEKVSLPPGVILKSVDPPTIKVDLDEMMKKELPVQVDWVGKLAANLILQQARLEPATVLVSGGKQILDKIATIYTEEVLLDNLKGTGTITADLALPTGSLKLAPNSRDKITIRYQTAPRND